MILFPKHNAAFVHFPKTAGRFITDLLTKKLKLQHRFVGNQHDPWSFHKNNDFQPIIVKRDWEGVFKSYLDWKYTNKNVICEPHIAYHPFWYVDEQLNAGSNQIHAEYFKFLEYQYYQKDMGNAIVIQYEHLHEQLAATLQSVFRINVTADELAKMERIR